MSMATSHRSELYTRPTHALKVFIMTFIFSYPYLYVFLLRFAIAYLTLLLPHHFFDGIFFMRCTSLRPWRPFFVVFEFQVAAWV